MATPHLVHASFSGALGVPHAHVHDVSFKLGWDPWWGTAIAGGLKKDTAERATPQCAHVSPSFRAPHAHVQLVVGSGGSPVAADVSVGVGVGAESHRARG